jgi:hypothetical protein
MPEHLPRPKQMLLSDKIFQFLRPQTACQWNRHIPASRHGIKQGHLFHHNPPSLSSGNCFY